MLGVPSQCVVAKKASARALEWGAGVVVPLMLRPGCWLAPVTVSAGIRPAY